MRDTGSTCEARTRSPMDMVRASPRQWGLPLRRMATKQVMVAVLVEADEDDALPPDDSVVQYVRGSVAGDALWSPNGTWKILDCDAPEVLKLRTDEAGS